MARGGIGRKAMVPLHGHVTKYHCRYDSDFAIKHLSAA